MGRFFKTSLPEFNEKPILSLPPLEMMLATQADLVEKKDKAQELLLIQQALNIPHEAVHDDRVKEFLDGVKEKTENFSKRLQDNPFLSGQIMNQINAFGVEIANRMATGDIKKIMDSYNANIYGKKLYEKAFLTDPNAKKNYDKAYQNWVDKQGEGVTTFEVPNLVATPDLMALADAIGKGTDIDKDYKILGNGIEDTTERTKEKIYNSIVTDNGLRSKTEPFLKQIKELYGENSDDYIEYKRRFSFDNLGGFDKDGNFVFNPENNDTESSQALRQSFSHSTKQKEFRPFSGKNYDSSNKNKGNNNYKSDIISNIITDDFSISDNYNVTDFVKDNLQSSVKFDLAHSTDTERDNKKLVASLSKDPTRLGNYIIDAASKVFPTSSLGKNKELGLSDAKTGNIIYAFVADIAEDKDVFYQTINYINETLAFDENNKNIINDLNNAIKKLPYDKVKKIQATKYQFKRENHSNRNIQPIFDDSSISPIVSVIQNLESGKNFTKLNEYIDRDGIFGKTNFNEKTAYLLRYENKYNSGIFSSDFLIQKPAKEVLEHFLEKNSSFKDKMTSIQTKNLVTTIPIETLTLRDNVTTSNKKLDFTTADLEIEPINMHWETEFSSNDIIILLTLRKNVKDMIYFLDRIMTMEILPIL